MLQPGGPTGQDLDYSLVLHPRDMTVTHARFPYALGGLSGTVLAKPGLVEIKDLAGGMKDSPVHLSGTIQSDARGGQADLNLTARNLPIDRNLIGALPSQTGELTGMIRPVGRCDVDLDKLTMTWQDDPLGPTTRPSPGAALLPAATQPAATQPAERVQWALAGKLTIAGAQLAQPVEANGISGSIQGNAAWEGTAQRLEMDLQLAMDAMRVNDRSLRRLTGAIIKRPDNPFVRVADLSADACGGRVAGSAELSVEKPSQYGLDIVVEGLQLDELLNTSTTAPATKPKGAGELAGSLRVGGTVGQNALREGSGKLRITKADIARLPVLLGLLNVIYLQLPGNTTYNSGTVTYDLAGDIVTLREIYLGGSDLSLLGSGTMDLATERLHLAFLAGPPKSVPPALSLMMEMLRAASKELMEIHVTGTLRQPRINTVPMKDLDNLFKEMLTPR